MAMNMPAEAQMKQLEKIRAARTASKHARKAMGKVDKVASKTQAGSKHGLIIVHLSKNRPEVSMDPALSERVERKNPQLLRTLIQCAQGIAAIAEDMDEGSEKGEGLEGEGEEEVVQGEEGEKEDGDARAAARQARKRRHVERTGRSIAEAGPSLPSQQQLRAELQDGTALKRSRQELLEILSSLDPAAQQSIATHDAKSIIVAAIAGENPT